MPTKEKVRKEKIQEPILVHAEEVHNEETKEQELPLAKRVESKFSIELKGHDLSRESLEAAAKKADAIKINGIDDKEGYKLADEARKDLKAKRVIIQKIGKAIRDEANKFADETLRQEREYIATIEAAEDRLQDEQDKIKKEKEEIEERKRQAAEQAFMERVGELSNMGARFDGTNYILGTTMLSAQMIRDAEPEVYAASIQPLFKATYDELKRVEKETADRLEQAGRMEKIIFDSRVKQITDASVIADNVYVDGVLFMTRADIVKADEDNFVAKVKALEEKRAESQRLAAEKEVSEKRLADRKRELYNMGLKWNGEDFEAGFIVQMKTVTDETDEQWLVTIENVKKAIKDRDDAAAETERIATLARSRYAELNAFDFKYPVMADLGKMSDVDYQAIKKDAKGRYDEAIAQEAADAAAAKKAADDAVAKEQLDAASDATKWNDFKLKVAGLQLPEMKSKKYKGLVAKAAELIRQIHVM